MLGCREYFIFYSRSVILIIQHLYISLAGNFSSSHVIIYRVCPPAVLEASALYPVP